MNKPLGRHILCEAYGCNPEVLTSRALVEAVMVDALRASAETAGCVPSVWPPRGQRCGSHIGVTPGHPYVARYGYAAIDVFRAVTELIRGMRAAFTHRIRATHSTTTEIERGKFEHQPQPREQR